MSGLGSKAIPPARFFCPITTELMVDPVMDCHGHNFERASILDWLGRSNVCPLSREVIVKELLFPNLALREEISEWLAASHPTKVLPDQVLPDMPTLAMVLTCSVR